MARSTTARRAAASRTVSTSHPAASHHARAGGRRSLTPHAQVHIAEIQRARILAAMFDVAAKRGAGDVSVAHVVKRSGVSRRTFYEAFDDREDCFLAAFEDALAFASQPVLTAYGIVRKWHERVRESLIALLVFLDEEPAMGRFLVVESLSGGARTLERRREVLAQLAAALEEGRPQSASASSLPPLTAEGLVGGVLAVIHARIVLAEREPLVGLANQLMSMIVLPYGGPAAARRELQRPVEAAVNERPQTRLLADPFKDANMRLTYRTMRVLMAVADNPNASNRMIGDAAGIGDQGQISKLLGRLTRIGLIANTGLEPGPGAPNAWALTGKGDQLAESIRIHTQHADPGQTTMRKATQ